jgi:hypothetical protein
MRKKKSPKQIKLARVRPQFLTLEREEEEEEVEVEVKEEEAATEEGKTGCCLRSKKGRPAVVVDRFVLRLEIRSSSSW